MRRAISLALTIVLLAGCRRYGDCSIAIRGAWSGPAPSP